MILLDWTQILPSAVQTLRPLHRELVSYVINLRGKSKPSYKQASQQWNLSRDEFDQELASAFSEIRHHLSRYGLRSSGDLKAV